MGNPKASKICRVLNFYFSKSVPIELKIDLRVGFINRSKKFLMKFSATTTNLFLNSLKLLIFAAEFCLLNSLQIKKYNNFFWFFDQFSAQLEILSLMHQAHRVPQSGYPSTSQAMKNFHSWPTQSPVMTTTYKKNKKPRVCTDTIPSPQGPHYKTKCRGW